MRSILKGLANWGLGFGLSRKWLFDHMVWVFCYHDVTNAPSQFAREYGLHVSPEFFAAQVALFKAHCTIISPEQLLSGQFDLPAALITFDDGWAGAFENAVPVLEDADCPSLHFINCDVLDGGLPWMALVCWLCSREPDFVASLPQDVAAMDARVRHVHVSPQMVEAYLEHGNRAQIERDVREYVGPMLTRESANRERPLVYYGSHLSRHQSALVFRDDLEALYFECQDEVDKLPGGSRLFSYPFGMRDNETDRRLMGYGARRLFSSEERPNMPGDHLLGRVNMKESMANDTIFLRSLLRLRLENFWG